MGKEIDLLKNYPRTKRDPSARAAERTEEDIALARQFGKDFFDGERKHGYGGFKYDPRFWKPVYADFVAEYGDFRTLLDVGCAKGFMLYDFTDIERRLTVRGIDISHYAIEHAMERVKPWVQQGNATRLPYKDQCFDLVISINTVHNLEREGCIAALREIERVSKKNSYITVDAYRTEKERKRMLDWNLTAKTILHVDEWVVLFAEAGYTGDYGWFIP